MLYVMEASEPVVAETEAADLSKKEAVGTDDSDQVDKSNEPDKEAVDDDDLEDGEITDDDEEEDEAAAEHSHPAENEDKDGDRSDGGSESSRQEDRGNRHRKSRRDKKRDKPQETSIEDDEAKKERLKEKLRQLEMQMMDEEDEMAGVYSSGHDGRRKRRSSSLEDGSDEDGSGRSGSRSPQNRPRGHKDKKRRRGNDPNANEEELGQRGLGGFGRGRGGGNNGDKGDPPGKLPPWANPNEGQVMELCKFYVLERCAKREKCLYLHKGFPCKFFHCGMPEWQCPDTAESCKFSHEPLTDVTRPILLKHLEAAPKEILGEFPRLNREQAAHLVYQTEAKSKGWLNNQKGPAGPQRSAADNMLQSAGMPNNPMQGFPPGPGPNFPPQGGPPPQQGGPQGGPQGGGGGPPPRKSRWGQGDPNNDPNAQVGGSGFGFPPSGGPGPRMGFRMTGLPPPGVVRPNLGPGLLGPRPPGMGQPPMGGGGPGGGFGPHNGPPRPPHGPHGLRPPIGGFPGGPNNPNNLPIGGGNNSNSYGDNRQGGNQFSSQKETYGNSKSDQDGAPSPAGQQQQSVAQDPWMAGLNQKQQQTEEAASRQRETTPTPEENMDFGAGGQESSDGEQQLAVKQKIAFEKLQQMKKERKASLDERKMKEVNPVFKEENWYSSDDEAAGNSQKGAKREEQQVKEEPSSTTTDAAAANPPEIKTDVKVATVAEPAPVTTTRAPKRDPRMTRRDPRQRENKQAATVADEPPKPVAAAAPDAPVVPDVDLSMFEELDIPTFGSKDEELSGGNNGMENDDEGSQDFGGLPFKPHKMPAMAKEIDASIFSHSPLEYRLKAIVVTKPDYSEMVLRHHIPASKIQVDPRLRRYANLKKSAGVPEMMDGPAPFKSPPSEMRSPQQNNKRLSQDDDNVYNPMKDLTRQPPPQQQQRHDYSQSNAYSPSQEPQDMYNAGHQQGGYNPRQDQKGWGIGGGDFGGNPAGSNPYEGGGGGFYGSSNDNFYGGNNQNPFGNQPTGFNAHHTGGGGGGGGFGYQQQHHSNGGGGGGGFGGPMRGQAAGGGNKDPRRRDPRQRN